MRHPWKTIFRGKLTQEEVDKSNLRREIYVALRKGDQQKAMELFKQGKADVILATGDYIIARREANKNPLVNSFSRLAYDQAKRVMDVANDEERGQLRVPFLRKQMAERSKGHTITVE